MRCNASKNLHAPWKQPWVRGLVVSTNRIRKSYEKELVSHTRFLVCLCFAYDGMIYSIDLAMRFGMHSGPITAGVLRGDKTRFQLFGDTMNVAARMESKYKRPIIYANILVGCKLDRLANLRVTF
jgi:hypothetical protein